MYRFTIKDLEYLSGIKAHTIRIWEQRYALLSPERSHTNIRFYPVDELKILLNVCLLNKYGYKISVITEMPEDDLQHAIANLKQPEARHEYIGNALFLYLVNNDIDGFENLMNSYITTDGITACLFTIIPPFFERMALLRDKQSFKGGTIETFYNIIRQEIIAGIEQHGSMILGNKTILFFLPEGEHYEIELLYMQYLMQQQGLHVIYLGANVPVKDVVKIASYKKPDYIYTQLNNECMHAKTDKYLGKLSLLFKEFTILITGRQLQHYKKHIPGNIRLKFSRTEALMSVL